MQITSTPWGTPDRVEQVAEGIVFVSTMSHGGFYLSADRNAKVSLAWRRGSFNGRAMDGWYEEDSDYALVVLSFPELFDERQKGEAKRTFDYSHKDKLRAA
jgi:hypothetical protein